MAICRAITNLSTMSKLLDRLVLGRQMSYEVSSGNFGVFHSAYRARHSTETALLRVFNDVVRNIGTQCIIVLIALDISTVFVTTVFSVLADRPEVDFDLNCVVPKWLLSSLTELSTSVLVRPVLHPLRAWSAQMSNHWVDKDLTLDRHVTGILRGCSNHTLAFWHVRPLIHKPTARLVLLGVVTFRLDYCNGMLCGTLIKWNIYRLHAGCSKYIGLSRASSYTNSMANICIVWSCTGYQAPRTCTDCPQWLPVRQLIDIKLAVVTTLVQSTGAAAYLAALVDNQHIQMSRSFFFQVHQQSNLSTHVKLLYFLHYSNIYPERFCERQLHRTMAGCGADILPLTITFKSYFSKPL